MDAVIAFLYLAPVVGMLVFAVLLVALGLLAVADARAWISHREPATRAGHSPAASRAT